jgi:DNA-binding transcriptional LysR family regulator
VTWLPHFVSTLHRRLPKLTLEFDVALTADLLAKLNSGDLDVALLPGSHFAGNIEAQSLGTVEFAWMASPSLDIPARLLTPVDFRPWRVLSLGGQSYHSRTVEQWVGGGQRQQVDTCNSMSILASLTMAGLGISLLPPGCYRGEVKSGRLRRLRTNPKVPKVEFWVVHLKRRNIPVLPLLVATARETSAFSSGARAR